MRANKNLIIALFWGLIFIILICQILAIDEYSFSEAILYSGVIIGTFGLIFYLLSAFLFAKRIGIKKVNYFIIPVFIFSIVASSVLTLEDYILNSLFKNDWTFDNNSSFPQFFGMMMASILTSGVAYAYQLYQHHLETLESKQLLKDQMNDLEMKSIRQQLSPHFTFNVLNNLQFLIQKDRDEALRLLQQYSGLLRYYVYQSQHKVILLDEELSFIKTYMELEKDRLQEEAIIRVEFDVEFDVESKKYQIAPFILSTFVENSFKHLSNNKKEILIHVKVLNGQLNMFIKNSFDNSSNNSQVDKGVGLFHVEKRLKLIYPKKYNLTIQKEENWFIVSLQLNLLADETN